VCLLLLLLAVGREHCRFLSGSAAAAAGPRLTQRAMADNSPAPNILEGQEGKKRKS